MMGSHRLLAKCVMFEEATRVPLMVRMPGQKKGRRVAGPVSQLDLVPTLLDLMGRPVPADLPGRSLRPAIEGEAEGERDVFIEWNGPNCGLAGDVIGKVDLPEWMNGMADRESAVEAITDPVRSIVSADLWKMNCSPRGDHELYNLAEDPEERMNLAFDPGQQERAKDLVGRIRAWQERTEDEVPLPDPPYRR
jgi:arylsulfatase A-like enzyme